MKTEPSRKPQVAASAAGEAEPRRRRLIVGAGVATAAALAAAAVLRRRGEGPAGVVEAEPETAKGQGYRLTDHVLRYYQTTRS